MKRYGVSLLVVGILLLLPLGATANADLAEVEAVGALVWGGDQEGGGPYVFPRDDDPAEVTGFEVELAAELARELGVEARFSQGQWDRMPDLLRTGKVDVILNGYEWSPVRAELMDATIPYLVYELQLLARKDDDTLRSWGDLRTPRDGRRRRIGVLGGSAAEAYVITEAGDGVEVVSYEGNTDAMREVETGKLDATVQDTPIVAFYAPRFPGLRPVGEPVGRGHYVAFVRKGETALLRALDAALIRLLRNGTIEAIDRRWGLWNEAQKELLTIADAGRFYGFHAATSGPGETAIPEEREALLPARGLEAVARYGPILVRSAAVTIVLAFLSFPLAIGLGLVVAIGRLHGPAWLRAALASYVEFLRGTPLMLQLYFIFFFLPEVGITVPAFWTAILGLAINYSAYESEIYRAGLQAVPPGQMEAALSLGMSRGLALRRIVLPQAVRIVIPPVVNDFIALFKDTSVCSVVTVVELTKRFSVLSQSTQSTVELMILTAILYMLMSTPLSFVASRLERRLGREAPA